MRAAFGLKARTGRATLVAVAGDTGDPQFVERSQLALLPVGAWAPYHAARGLDPVEARASVTRSVAAAHGLARSGIDEARQRLTKAGYDVCGCAVLTGSGMPDWSTDEILAVPVRMHKAEGELFRDVLVIGARACDVPVTTIPDKSALDEAGRSLGLARPRLDAVLAALGKAAGTPWGKDQKEAAAAALVALRRFGTGSGA